MLKPVGTLIQELRVQRMLLVSDALSSTPAVVGAALVHLLLKDLHGLHLLQVAEAPGLQKGAQTVEVLCRRPAMPSQRPSPLSGRGYW